MQRFITILALLLIVAPAAFGQMEKGDREIKFSGSLFAMDDFTMFVGQATYGKFTSANFQIGGGPTITYFDAMGYSSTIIGASFFGRYNFIKGTQTVPYLQGQFYQSDLAPDEPFDFTDMSFVQFGAGLKYFVNKYVAYDASANYGFGLGGGSGLFYLNLGIAAIF